MSRPARPCLVCGVPGRMYGRGLCGPCHARMRYYGRLHEFPRKTYSSDELMAEWDFLRRSGCTIDTAAGRLGITPKGLERAIDRAAKRGDERAQRRAAA